MRRDEKSVDAVGREARRFYTLAEASAQLGDIRRCFDDIMQLRTQAKKLHERLESAGYPADVDDDAQIRLSAADGADMDDEPPPISVLRVAGLLRAVYAALHEAIGRVQAMGCVIRDIETGFVDWPALRGGREIWLRWRYGQTQIHLAEGEWAGPPPEDG